MIWRMLHCLEADRKRKKRSKWCKSWLQKRDKLSHYVVLEELRSEPKDYLNYLRMDEPTFLELLSLVTPIIEKQDTLKNKAQLKRFGRFCLYTTPTPTLSSAHKISENSDQLQPRSANRGWIGVGEAHTRANLVAVGVVDRCRSWKSVSCMGPLMAKIGLASMTIEYQ